MIMLTRWWLIRHAPVINPSGTIYGQQNLEANCSDEPTFRDLAKRLPSQALWLVTPLKRTQQTSQALLAMFDESDEMTSIIPEVETDLIEQNLGAWQGQDYHTFYRQHGSSIMLAAVAPPGGECFTDVCRRVARVIERRSRDHGRDEQDIITIAHGGSIRAALAFALGIEPEMALRFCIDTLSLTRFDYIYDDPPVARVLSVNIPPLR